MGPFRGPPRPASDEEEEREPTGQNMSVTLSDELTHIVASAFKKPMSMEVSGMPWYPRDYVPPHLQESPSKEM